MAGSRQCRQSGRERHGRDARHRARDWSCRRRRAGAQARIFLAIGRCFGALEADNGLAWYDDKNRALHILVSTQSPYEGVTGAAEMLAKTNFRVDMIDF